MTFSASAALTPRDQTIFRGLSPLFLIIFFGFLSVGAPLPALSIHVDGGLAFGAVVVGWVIGAQSIVTVLTRHQGGTVVDRRGPKFAVLCGLPLASASGLLYLASTWCADPHFALGVLLAGRVTVGLAESLFITGAMGWGIGRIGPERTGRVMAWQGIAMFAALGIGAPVGLAVQTAFDFTGVALLTIASPLLALAVAVMLPAVAAGGGGRAPFHRIVGLIWRPGLVLALATAPFAAMATFLALHFAARDWTGPGLALLGFGAAYILVRLFFAHLPDKVGGSRVAAVSLLVEAVGQLMLWLGPDAVTASAGAILTGAGFSLIFPSMGVIATRAIPPAMRGRAIGNFMAFFDIALGLTGPLAGLAVGLYGTDSAFLIGTIAAAGALALLPGIARKRRIETG